MKKGTKVVRFETYLFPEQITWLTKLARRQRTSAAHVLREILRQAMTAGTKSSPSEKKKDK